MKEMAQKREEEREIQRVKAALKQNDKMLNVAR